MTFQLLKVGSDTEFFLTDRKTGEPVTAIGRFGGTKQRPRPVLDIEGFCIQEDNVMPEVNIPPASSAKEFYLNCDKILTWLREEAKKQGLNVEVCASMKFTPDKLDHPQAKNIGCERDFCVWTRTPNEFDQTKRAVLEYLRTAGGHLHISFQNSRRKITEQDQELLVMLCDLLLGVPSIVLDGDQERRKLYGRAGSFRFKPYGIEYRVLSNFWFKNPYLSSWTFNQVVTAVSWMNDKPRIRSLFDHAEEIQTAINTQDVDLSYLILQGWGLNLP